jgi:hypothetical protein
MDIQTAIVAPPKFSTYEFKVQRGACSLQKFTRQMEEDELFSVWDEIDRLAQKFEQFYARIEVFDQDDRLLISVGTSPPEKRFVFENFDTTGRITSRSLNSKKICDLWFNQEIN